jgi:hypothetical protein
MKKMSLMMLALAAMAAGSVQANEPAVAKAEGACAASLSVEEQAFAAKLGERQRKLFSMMNAEQRKAAMTAATDPAQTADGAVEKIMKEHHLSMADEQKAETK